jgi:hypothetical protein
MPGRKARFAGKLFGASVLRTPVTFGGQSHFVRPVPATPAEEPVYARKNYSSLLRVWFLCLTKWAREKSERARRTRRMGSRIGALRDDGAVRGYSRDDSACTEILSLRPGRQVRQILDCSDSFHWVRFKKTFAFPDILEDSAICLT